MRTEPSVFEERWENNSWPVYDAIWRGFLNKLESNVLIEK